MSANRPRWLESRSTRPRQRNWILQRFFRCRREHGANFRQRDRSRLSQNLIATLIDIAKTEHDRLGFIFGEHERRQEQTGPQHVADPRLAIDGSALGAEFGNVPIKRALGNTELGGKG